MSTDRATTDWQQLESRATAAIEAVGKSMTEQRRAVLMAIWTLRSVVTLEGMTASLDVRRAASRSSVARALVDFTDAGILQRVENRSGYVLAPAKPAILLVCRSCPSVGITEMRALEAEFAALSSANGFRMRCSAVEVTGVCSDCIEKSNLAAISLPAPPV